VCGSDEHQLRPCRVRAGASVMFRVQGACCCVCCMPCCSSVTGDCHNSSQSVPALEKGGACVPPFGGAEHRGCSLQPQVGTRCQPVGANADPCRALKLQVGAEAATLGSGPNVGHTSTIGGAGSSVAGRTECILWHQCGPQPGPAQPSDCQSDCAAQMLCCLWL
jgi:hypothetical protein